MSNLSSENLRYNIGHAAELLNLDEHTLMAYIHQLGLTPKVDEKSGTFSLSQRDMELLNREIAKSQGNPMKRTHPNEAHRSTAYPTEYASLATPYGQTTGSAAAKVASGTPEKKDNITVIVEAVSQVKEGILKDLSRLLDDKLAGLDEVVVELIRCKSENDSLKQKLKAAVDEKEAMRHELSKFKLVQFGFYRKTN